MGRFWAVTRVAALFLIAACASPLVHACEGCERVPLAPEGPQPPEGWRNIGRLDVTTAVDTATAFMLDAVRGLRWFSRLRLAPGDVEITQQELGSERDVSHGSDAIAAAEYLGAGVNIADYASAYDAGEIEPASQMPNFRREHRWQLTYRSDAADAISQPAQSDRFPGMNTTLDDSIVVGLRFQMEYGWTR